jgi:hypothetical protein
MVTSIFAAWIERWRDFIEHVKGASMVVATGLMSGW